MNFRAPRGTHDILPKESGQWQFVEQKFSELCRRFSYQEIRTPVFEQTELFARGVGDGTDIVQKEMYNFEDKAGRAMTLRPEGTAGVVRSYIEHGLASEPSPIKLYYNITAFRYEKMQKGRYREFRQLGCECFGSESASADAELITLLWLFFSELRIKNIHLEVNSIGCPLCRPAYKEALTDYLRPHLSELCEDCRRRFTTNPLRILDCKEKTCRGIAQDAPKSVDHLCPECLTHWEVLLGLLDTFAIPYNINPQIVRGLDYYSKTVFEFISENVGTQGTICGGGRYDGLVEELGGPATPGVGFALGVERLLLELEAQGFSFPEPVAPTIFIASFPEQRLLANQLAFSLRKEGLRAEVDICERSFKAQLKHANRIKAKYLLVLGDEELKQMCGKIKRMSDGAEKELSFSELAGFLVHSED